MEDLIVSVPDHCLSFYFVCYCDVIIAHIYMYVILQKFVRTTVTRVQCMNSLLSQGTFVYFDEQLN